MRGDHERRSWEEIMRGDHEERRSWGRMIEERRSWGWMIEEIIWSQAPNKVLMSTSPPIGPTEQLLPRSLRNALSQLRSGYCSRLQSYRQSVGWANDPTCPDCHSTYHTVAYLFSWANWNKVFFLLYFIYYSFILCFSPIFSLRRRHDCCEREKVYFFINIDTHLAFLQGLCITDSIKNVFFIIFLYSENLRMVLHMLCLLV